MLRPLLVSVFFCALTLASATAAIADDDISKVNGSIRVDDGKTAGDLESVNGSIRVGDNAQAKEISTVNGSIDIGDGATIDSADTVNGRISIGARVRVAKGVDAVNGSLTFATGSDVSGEVSNVNGDIRLQNAHVGGSIKTVSGDIEIGADSHVDGGILVEKSTSWFFSSPNKPLRIVIGPRAVVKGTLVFESEVHLFVSDSASIGAVTGATPVKFSGDNP